MYFFILFYSKKKKSCHCVTAHTSIFSFVLLRVYVCVYVLWAYTHRYSTQAAISDKGTVWRTDWFLCIYEWLSGTLFTPYQRAMLNSCISVVMLTNGGHKICWQWRRDLKDEALMFLFYLFLLLSELFSPPGVQLRALLWHDGLSCYFIEYLTRRGTARDEGSVGGGNHTHA